MAWDMALEDYEHRARRVAMFREQKLSHDLISQIFAEEQQEQLAQQAEQHSQLKATEKTQILDETIASKKFEVLQKIQESVSELNNFAYSDALASKLKRELFDKLIEENQEFTAIVIANYHKDGKLGFDVKLIPRHIDFNRINIRLAKEGD
jgi:hypothetical protein